MVDLFQTKAVERVVEEVEKSLKTISDELLAEKAAVVNGSVKDETFSEPLHFESTRVGSVTRVLMVQIQQFYDFLKA